MPSTEAVIQSQKIGNKLKRLPYLTSALLQVNILEEAKQLRQQDALTRRTGSVGLPQPARQYPDSENLIPTIS